MGLDLKTAALFGLFSRKVIQPCGDFALWGGEEREGKEAGVPKQKPPESPVMWTGVTYRETRSEPWSHCSSDNCECFNHYTAWRLILRVLSTLDPYTGGLTNQRSHNFLGVRSASKQPPLPLPFPHTAFLSQHLAGWGLQEELPALVTGRKRDNVLRHVTWRISHLWWL